MNKKKIKHLIIIFGILSANVIYSQTIGKNYAILISGLGGESHYSETFLNYLINTRKALIEQFQFQPENVIVLSEPKNKQIAHVDRVSNAENIRSIFYEFSQKLSKNDHLYVILFGHGSFNGKQAKFNIPRQDLTNDDYGQLVDRIPANRIIFVNTASSSFPFIQSLSKENRIIITATSSASQKNSTVFPKYFVEGLSKAEADLDKNGNLSILELATYAAQKTDRFFEKDNHLATEFAMLEDTGDKKAFRINDLADSGEGTLSGLTYLNRNRIYLTNQTQSSRDSVFVKLIRDKEQIELKISQLRSQKNTLEEQDYFARLEDLMVKLARINDRIENKQKK